MNEKAIEKLLNPPPNGKIAAAKAFGIDLTLLARNPGLTPDERINGMTQAVEDSDFFAREMKKSLSIKQNEND